MNMRERLAQWLLGDPDTRVVELEAQLAATQRALRDKERMASTAREGQREALRARNDARGRLTAVQRIAADQSLPAGQAMDRIRQVLMLGEVGERG